MKVHTLASGSSGNSTLIESANAKILVDAGISLRKLRRTLDSIETKADEIDAVVLTHEHSDHAKAITDIGIPVYVSSETASLWEGKIDALRQFRTGSPFSVGDILITPFPVPHDAVDPVGFVVESDGSKVGLVTDIGCVTGLVSERLRGADMLIVESNHDEKSLIAGSYPWELKQRVGGRLGHLSNRQCAQLLETVAHEKLMFVVLAHLSGPNNEPELALSEATGAMQRAGFAQVSVSVAPRHGVGEVFVI